MVTDLIIKLGTRWERTWNNITKKRNCTQRAFGKRNNGGEGSLGQKMANKIPYASAT